MPVCFPLHFSRTFFSPIKRQCATMQCLITLSINTSSPPPGRWGSNRNSRCLLLLLTSASTAVKLDHYDANLRRCCNPGEEPGSVRLIEGKEESKSEAKRRKADDAYLQRMVREGDRQRTLPGRHCEHSDDGTTRFTYMPHRQQLSLAPCSHLLIPFCSPERMWKLKEH